MKKELEILDQYLKTKRTDFYSELNSPLTEKEIKVLEDKFNIKLPSDLKILYSWKNGQNNDWYDSFVNNSTFMPLEEVLISAAEMTSMIGSDFEIENWWHKDWLPILSNGGGNYICYDMGGLFTGQKGQLIEFLHEDNDRNVIAPNLPVFIKKINEYYSSTPKENIDEYFKIESIDGFPKEFIVK